MVAQLFERASISFVIGHSPEARAMKSARLIDNVCSFPVARSQLVEANYNWVGPIAISQYALYQQQSNEPQLLSLQDASPYQIVAYEGYSIAQQLQEQGFNIVMTEEVDDGLQMLRRENIDLWLSDTRTAMALSEDLGIQLANQPFVFLTDIKYLACNKEIPANQISKLQTQVNSMIKTGELVLIPREQ
ncbi:hypothetical protein [Vibrio sp. TBV020]|uniref:hypothetical protein n=1 Tax=Vibrio sp. TBV020 TaxID=3137398 RepID=UPI0038CD2788